MKRIAQVLAGFLILLICLEIALRLAGMVYARNLIKNNAQSKTNQINIVCLGESSTAGLWVPWEDSYPKQLEVLLRTHYQRDDINVIVPVHIGQNSSQIANRIHWYLNQYHPRLVIMMIGANNTWSLSETNAIRYFKNHSKSMAAFHALAILNDLRVFKLARYVYIRFIKNRDIHFAAPDYDAWPPKQWVFSASGHNPAAFEKMWEYDVRTIHAAADARDVNTLMMSYAMPIYIPEAMMERISAELNIPFVRNEKSFKQLQAEGALEKHLMHDLWHPSSEGYAVIANNAFNKIKEKDLLKLGSAAA